MMALGGSVARTDGKLFLPPLFLPALGPTAHGLWLMADGISQGSSLASCRRFGKGSVVHCDACW
jgi:hypothetical protein